MLNHHAYLCQMETLPVNCVGIIPKDLAIFEREDLVHENFGIDEVRKLTEKAYLTPNQGEFRLITITFKGVTVEAQQALLKLTEEPPKTTKLFFITGKGVNFLPTLLSRFSILEIEETVTKNNTWIEFIELSLMEKMNLIAKKMEAKDQDWLLGVRSGLGALIQEKLKNLTAKEGQALYFIFQNLGQRGAANKMLLEEMTLTLERIKEKL